MDRTETVYGTRRQRVSKRETQRREALNNHSRYMQTRNKEYQSNEAENNTAMNILRQIIICGILMAFVLMVSIIKIPVFENIRAHAKQLISNNISITDIQKTAESISKGFNSFVNSVSTVLSKNHNNTSNKIDNSNDISNGINSVPADAEKQIPDNGLNNADHIESHLNGDNHTSDDTDRIDEDILDMINSD